MTPNLTWGNSSPATQKRLAEAVLYVAERTKEIGDFGSIKMNKALYYADMEWFRSHGVPLTGGQYHKIERGPVPKHILAAERMLENSGALAKDVSITAHKRIAQRAPDTSIFTAEQLAVLDAAIERVKDGTSTKVSHDSHDIRWHALQVKDLIPYELAFLSDETTDKDRQDAEQMAEAFGW